MICGAQRSGKSLLAESMAKENALQLFNMDKIRHSLFNETLSVVDRKKLADRKIREIMSLHPRRAVIEGVTAYNLCRDSLEKHSFPAPVFFIGFTGDIADKRRGIDTYRAGGKCWTLRKDMSDQMLDNLAKNQVALSLKQRDFCLQYGYEFIEIRPAHFYFDMHDAARKIVASLRGSEVI
jgi:hypothetical protein